MLKSKQMNILKVEEWLMFALKINIKKFKLLKINRLNYKLYYSQKIPFKNLKFNKLINNNHSNSSNYFKKL